jgi:flagellar basal body rod protein FlgB
MGTHLSKHVAGTRDAGQQQAGFRLQKLRAVELLFDSVEKSETALVYCSIENEEDVNHVDSTGEKTQYLEQNKQYDPDSSFTAGAGFQRDLFGRLAGPMVQE